MTETETLFSKKIDNLQDQLDVMHRESAVFRAYVNRQFTRITNDTATKEDIRIIRTEMATKADLRILTDIVIKIAEKVGVST